MSKPAGKTALPIAKLTLDPRCDPRALAPDPQTVQGYYEGVVDGSIDFPPLDVVSDGETNWLVDGRLRLRAFQLAGRSHAECHVSPGTLREARLRAAAANATHGRQRTNEDKRRQVWSLLSLLDEEESINSWSAQQVARHCSVSGPLVNGLKALFVEAKKEARRKTEQAEQARAGLASPPEEEPETAPEDEFISVADPEAPKADDDEAAERHDLAMIRERGYRALRKADRFAVALGLTLEQLIADWRADGQDTLQRDQQRQLAVLAREGQEDREAAAKGRSPWDDD